MQRLLNLAKRLLDGKATFGLPDPSDPKATGAFFRIDQVGYGDNAPTSGGVTALGLHFVAKDVDLDKLVILYREIIVALHGHIGAGIEVELGGRDASGVYFVMVIRAAFKQAA